VDAVRGPKLFGRRHLLLPFNDPPSGDRVAELKRRHELLRLVYEETVVTILASDAAGVSWRTAVVARH
jgi:hypothetical protein